MIQKIKDILEFGDEVELDDGKMRYDDSTTGIVVIVNPWGRGGTSFRPPGGPDNVR